jgi:hypothetical protein
MTDISRFSDFEEADQKRIRILEAVRAVLPEEVNPLGSWHCDDCGKECLIDATRVLGSRLVCPGHPGRPECATTWARFRPKGAPAEPDPWT